MTRAVGIRPQPDQVADEMAIRGLTHAFADAVNQRDYPIITGVFLIVGVAVMLINLLVDLSYGLLDPKVRYR